MKKIEIFAVLLLLAMLLAASGNEESPAATSHVDWFSVLGKVVNSTILFGGLALMLRKPLIRMLSDKGAAIEKDFHEREKNLADTTIRLRDIEQRLQKVTVEVEQIKANAVASGQEELACLEAAGREEAGRIIALSRRKSGCGSRLPCAWSKAISPIWPSNVSRMILLKTWTLPCSKK